METNLEIKGNYVDIENRSIYPVVIQVKEGKIASIEKIEESQNYFLLPGFIDAHIHIESSMVTPQAFSQVVAPFGTVATVSDPHEIANVCGVEGVLYMIELAKKAAVKIHFGAPSCVPATSFETAGAEIDSDEIRELLKHPDIYYLTEMMNFPGVLNGDQQVAEKIKAAKVLGKPIDGHAPGLRGKEAKAYIEAGISTDHECTTIEEALDKLQFGMKILIREGSAAKNFEALVPLFKTHPKQLMFCSDDKHPDELVRGHINELVVRAIGLGYNMFDVLHAACLSPIAHYDLPVGKLAPGDAADFILVKDLEHFEVHKTFINGNCVSENGISLETFELPRIINNFNCEKIVAEDLVIQVEDKLEEVEVKVIVALDGQLLTENETVKLKVKNGTIQADAEQDVLKIVVVNRYEKAKPAIGFIKNFGFEKGAIASSVAHDSHNIVAVGIEEEAIAKAINAIIDVSGGISVFDGKNTYCMPLVIAGLMTNSSAKDAALEYEKLDKIAKALGSTLKAPFMTLSFMALPVIPFLKMTDKGLFDVNSFNFTTLVESNKQ